jgi:phage recombination protein Bet
MTNIIEYKNQIKNDILGNREVFNVLATKTFKGLDIKNIPQALLEGMMRGYKLEDFITKNVYAVPFFNKKEETQDYSLVESIDFCRKKAQKSGQSGKSKPEFTFKENNSIDTCTVIIYKTGGDERGYGETVFFDEYNTSKNLWVTKPKTMIAKVAEMHALRMAFPEELEHSYIEEEFEKEHIINIEENPISDELRKIISEAKTNEELKKIRKENEGLGKSFDKLITDQMEFIKSVKEQENA